MTDIKVSLDGLINLCENETSIFLAVSFDGDPTSLRFYEGKATGLYYSVSLYCHVPWQADVQRLDVEPDLHIVSPAGVLRTIPVSWIEGWTRADAYRNLTLDNYAEHWRKVNAVPFDEED